VREPLSDGVWGEIPECPGYFASTDGRLSGKYGRVLKPQLAPNGYLSAVIRVEKQPKTISVHRAVASAFIPNPENKRDVNHKNGVKLDNTVGNLEWVTHAENAVHGFALGLLHQGDKHPNTKLSDEQVRDIRRRGSMGRGSRAALAREYGVMSGTISQICLGRTRRGA